MSFEFTTARLVDIHNFKSERFVSRSRRYFQLLDDFDE